MYILYICNVYIYVYMFYIYQCKIDFDKLLKNECPDLIRT